MVLLADSWSLFLSFLCLVVVFFFFSFSIFPYRKKKKNTCLYNLSFPVVLIFRSYFLLISEYMASSLESEQ